MTAAPETLRQYDTSSRAFKGGLSVYHTRVENKHKHGGWQILGGIGGFSSLSLAGGLGVLAEQVVELVNSLKDKAHHLHNFIPFLNQNEILQYGSVNNFDKLPSNVQNDVLLNMSKDKTITDAFSAAHTVPLGIAGGLLEAGLIGIGITAASTLIYALYRLGHAARRNE